MANWHVTLSSYRQGKATTHSLEAVKTYLKRAFEAGEITMVRNIDLYRDLSGAVVVRALRYESLQADFILFMRELGIHSPPPLPHVKKGLMSDGIDPRAVFTRPQLDTINDVYSEEFVTFGRERL